MNSRRQQHPSIREAEPSNEQPVTCCYCLEPIAPGRGIYLEQADGRQRMGWTHSGSCKWHTVTVWKQEAGHV